MYGKREGSAKWEDETQTVCASKKKGELFNVQKVKKGGFNHMVVQKEEEGVTLLGNSQDKETRYIPHGNQHYRTEDVQNLGSFKKVA